MQKFLHKFEAHGSGINAIAFGPNYKTFITVGDDKKLIKWNLPSLSQAVNIPTVGIVNNIRYSEEAQALSLSCQDKAIRILDLTNDRFKAELKTHSDQATDSCWISKIQLLSASKDRTVKLYDINRLACIHTFITISSSYSITPTPANNLYAVGCFDQKIRFIDPRDRKIVNTIDLKSGAVLSIIPSITGDVIYSLGLGGKLVATSVKTMTVMQEWKSNDLEIKNYNSKISISPDGGYVAVPSQKGCALLFDVLSASMPIVLDHKKEPVISTAYAGNMLITGTADKNLYFWV